MDILNSNLYRFLDRLTNLFFLNVLWLLISLPLVTLFPASAAMFAVFKEWTEGKEGNLFKSFFKHFQANFKHSFLYGLLFGFLLAIFYLDLSIINEIESYSFILTSLLFVLVILTAFNVVYFVPISIHFDLTLFGKIKHAFLFSIMFFPTTLLCIIICIATLLLTYLLPGFMFILFSTAGYGVFRLCYRTFRKVGKV